jgi:hypothetical protein
MRTIRTEHGVDETIRKLGIEHVRFDDLMASIETVLCGYPETFPVIPGTALSWCRTNEFVGVSFNGIPALSMYFHFDDNYVYLLTIEECKVSSFGIPAGVKG